VQQPATASLFRHRSTDQSMSLRLSRSTHSRSCPARGSRSERSVSPPVLPDQRSYSYPALAGSKLSGLRRLLRSRKLCLGLIFHWPIQIPSRTNWYLASQCHRSMLLSHHSPTFPSADNNS